MKFFNEKPQRIGSILFVIFFLLSLIFLVYTGLKYNVKQQNSIIDFQHDWFVKHYCKKYGYARYLRTYMCDDGVQYILSDIPEHD